jgi:hypothetical protein
MARPKPQRRKRRPPRPHCEKCGCTEAHACEGGCAWDPVALDGGHYICNRCTGRHQLAEL